MAAVKKKKIRQSCIVPVYASDIKFGDYIVGRTRNKEFVGLQGYEPGKESLRQEIYGKISLSSGTNIFYGYIPEHESKPDRIREDDYVVTDIHNGESIFWIELDEETWYFPGLNEQIMVGQPIILIARRDSLEDRYVIKHGIVSHAHYIQQTEDSNIYQAVFLEEDSLPYLLDRRAKYSFVLAYGPAPYGYGPVAYDRYVYRNK